MLENSSNSNDNRNSEINLNLKVPPESPDGSFSMKDLVLTLYNARKIFLTWCCIGLILGIIAAGGYYMLQKRGAGSAAETGDVSVSLTLNYPGAESALFPNGAGFSVKSFYDTKIWENVIASVGRDDISPADVMNEVQITRYAPKLDAAGQPIVTSAQEAILPNILFKLTIPSSSGIFKDKASKEEFLKALCEEYKNFINDKYFISGNAGILYGQYMKSWNDACKEIIWDTFSFEKNFDELDTRYTTLAYWLEVLYSADPAYKTSDGKSFNDYAKEFRSICDSDIKEWTAKINENVYIRNIDRFKNEYQFQIDSMKMNRDYSLETVASYNQLLSSFQQKDTSQGAIVPEAVGILNAAKAGADTSADLQRQISKMEYNIGLLDTNEAVLRANSQSVETALISFINNLKTNQEKLTKIIYDYYSQVNKDNAENSIIYTTPTVLPAQSGSSMTTLLMLVVGLTFVGVVIGFFAAFVKKYIPQKDKVKTENK